MIFQFVFSFKICDYILNLYFLDFCNSTIMSEQ
jgi:hypothetical protein